MGGPGTALKSSIFTDLIIKHSYTEPAGFMVQRLGVEDGWRFNYYTGKACSQINVKNLSQFVTLFCESQIGNGKKLYQNVSKCIIFKYTFQNFPCGQTPRPSKTDISSDPSICVCYKLGFELSDCSLPVFNNLHYIGLYYTDFASAVLVLNTLSSKKTYFQIQTWLQACQVFEKCPQGMVTFAFVR